MVATRSTPSSTNTDPRILELFDVVKALQDQNAKLARRNEEQCLRSEALEAKEVKLQEQLAEMQNNKIEATKALLRAFQPFTAAIEAVVVPHRFREPSIGTYDGTGDPQIHVDAFQTQMKINGGNDAVSCKMFVGTLTDVALKWFKGLTSRSITGPEGNCAERRTLDRRQRRCKHHLLRGRIHLIGKKKVCTFHHACY